MTKPTAMISEVSRISANANIRSVGIRVPFSSVLSSLDNTRTAIVATLKPPAIVRLIEEMVVAFAETAKEKAGAS